MNRICLNCDVREVSADRRISLCEDCLGEVFPEGLIERESVARCCYCGEPHEWKEMISTSGGDMCADCQAGYTEAGGGNSERPAHPVACTYRVE